MRPSPAASNQRIADRLLAEGRLTPSAHAEAVRFVGMHGGRIEDALLDIDAITEADLLRWLATVHSTRFVSTEKLYKAQIDPRLIRLLPSKLADMHQVVPVMYDDATKTLTVVTADPDHPTALQEVKLATGVHAVSTLIARPAAVKAAVQRAYHNDSSAFASLIGGGAGGLQLSLGGAGAAAAMGNTARSITSGGLTISHDRGEPTSGNAAARNAFAVSARSITNNQPPPAPREKKLPAPPARQAKPRPKAPEPEPEPDFEEYEEEEIAPSEPPPPKPAKPPPRAARPAPAPEQPPVTLSTDYVETLNVLISLLENARPDLRGHSAMVARIGRKLADRMGLSPVQIASTVVAAYLHDLGKAGTYHLTALNVAEYDGHRTAAQKVFTVPERFLQIVNLTSETKAAVAAMYERFDGQGFPLGLAGKEIPLGARIIAVADTYADLTVNPRNPARKVLTPPEAVSFLDKHRSTVFDPTVIDLLRNEVAGDDLRAKILADRHSVLLVDPDPEETTILELRLLEQGFDVRIARTAQQALHELKSKEYAVVVSEIDVDTPDAGLALRSQAIAEPWGSGVTWIVHTRKTDREIAQIVFDLGVDDMVSKPTPPDVFVTKIRQLLERRKRTVPAAVVKGVSGSLAEMGLPDVVQVLWHGRKTCALRLTTAKGAGEIGFAEGQIVDARFGATRGEDAFYKMLGVHEGEFRVDPDYTPGERTIDASPEGLLLEGMRRMDEGLLK